MSPSFFLKKKSKTLYQFSLALSGIGLIIFGSSLFLSGLKSFNLSYLKWKISPPVYSTPIDESLPIHPSSLVELVNKERQRENLSPLKENNHLSYLAYLRAKVILENDDFSHAVETDSLSMSDLAKEIGYKYTLLGENLAKDFNREEDVIYRWTASPKHKENILSKKFKETGVAVVKGEFEGKETIVVVQIFGEEIGLFK